MMADDPLHDPEREHLARTGGVLKRVDRCANAGCAENVREGHCYCSDVCAADSWLRSERRWVGGSIAREVERPKYERDPIGGTRHPRENSRKGDGYE